MEHDLQAGLRRKQKSHKLETFTRAAAFPRPRYGYFLVMAKLHAPKQGKVELPDTKYLRTRNVHGAGLSLLVLKEGELRYDTDCLYSSTLHQKVRAFSFHQALARIRASYSCFHSTKTPRGIHNSNFSCYTKTKQIPKPELLISMFVEKANVLGIPCLCPPTATKLKQILCVAF